ncbi:YbhB/YbcL family Raf kinase inhibitor-like protein [Paenibacillus oenotherae]|uniref:YbhB/YbcL family Raf kinase inhibitor-like protein n=1 Tax=Paenibacillus oenotherae TaxID=1435645 RepID=A0ABS7D9B0_9BACL|nr:YbhB/YbcL family Raf kinase inhibitor-like protein [Paenibacillus oenotherae]MBW7476379.1 YbhB/YbcL family Raf kinase inhibitor-like protein [Paenibacillus oenotherae]
MQIGKGVHLARHMALILLIAAVGFILAGCSGNSSESAGTMTNEPFAITSTAFKDSGRIDIKHTNDNDNISVPLAWSNTPEGTKSIALVMVDLHPIADEWVHWIIVDIPADAKSLAEGSSRTDGLPGGSKELKNSFNTIGYGGPQPPAGSGDHEYKFIAYALNVEQLDVPEQISYDDFQKLAAEHVIDKAEISGFYENK